MKALVGVKRVIDYTVRIRVKQDNSGVEKASVKHSMNPFCEIAVEEALRLKEKGVVSHITALSIGDKLSSETLRTALALGVDEAIHVMTNKSTDIELSSLTVTSVLKHFILKNNYEIVILGKQAIDSDFNQTAQMLSGSLNWPIVAFASEVKHEKDKKFVITKEVDSGLQRLSVTAPFVLSCDLRLNTPRYTNLKGITAAKKKPLNTFNLEELGVNIASPIKTVKVESPPVKPAGVRVADVDELISKLRNEAKLI
jgi:electron transfer flavoprotein beta subunit